MAKQAAYGTMLNWGDGGGTEAFAPVAYVTNIGGPGLALDVEDVTSHDQATAWEEVVPTILRSGEVSIDLVFDPADDTQDFTETLALGSQMEARGTATNFQIVCRKCNRLGTVCAGGRRFDIGRKTQNNRSAHA
jgi:hypothetical protein